jgi:hypothetical protein
MPFWETVKTDDEPSLTVALLTPGIATRPQKSTEAHKSDSLKPTSHSYLSASRGSTLVARRAGI